MSSVLSELLAAVKAGDGTDLILELAQWALQQLIDRGDRGDRRRPLRAHGEP